MTHSHTPGPWRIGDAGATVFGPKTDKPSPATIAAMGRAGGDAEAARANARLIAAAPDMLAALEAFVGSRKGDGMGWTLDSLEAMARDAIAKAKGGEP